MQLYQTLQMILLYLSTSLYAKLDNPEILGKSFVSSNVLYFPVRSVT